MWLALSWPLAAAANPLARAEALIVQNETAAALEILSGYVPGSAQEEQRKMWAQAIALVRENRPRQALPLLEKLVSLDPASAKYRLELAAALMSSAQDERAKYHFGILRGSVDDADISRALDERLAALDRRKSWEGTFSLALSPESNAARRTAADTIIIGGLPFVLNPAAQARPATGLRLVLGGAVLPLVAPDTRLRFGVSLDTRYFEGNKAPNDTTISAQVGLVRFGDRARQMAATLNIAQRWIDGDPYALTSGVTLVYSQLTGRSGSVLISGRVQDINYDSPGVASAQEAQLRLRYSYNLSPRFQLYGSGSVELRESGRAQDEGTQAALTVGGQYLFDGGLQVGLELAQSWLERDGIEPLFGQRREDDKTMVSVRVINRNWSAGGFTPVLELGLERQTSSIPLYSYENRRFSIGVTRRF